MSRPDPIEYAERLYAAIRDANFSTISFLAFGNAVKDGVDLRRMPRIAAEPFMRVVGEMLDLEEGSSDPTIIDADVQTATTSEAVSLRGTHSPPSISASLPVPEAEGPASPNTSR
jgi:hypothetical protein